MSLLPCFWRQGVGKTFVSGCLTPLLNHWIMSSKSKAPHSLVAAQCKYNRRLQHTDSNGGRNEKEQLKLQFPALPKEWEGKYIPGQMYQHQHSLPGLPVPPLQQTLQKYITSVEPILNKEELDQTQSVVTEFGKPGGVGEKLQEKLLERAKVKDNWLTEWWNHIAYLGFRESVVIHSSAAVGFPRKASKTVEDYVKGATTTVLCRVKWGLLIEHEAVPPDVYRGKPMCMGQHDCFSKCRLPGSEVDTVRKTPIFDSRHIVVIRNGHFFKLDVLYECPDGTLAVPPASHIIEQLHYILNAVPESCEYPVGILTTEHRDTWYQCRERLLQDAMNRSSLDVIERAQFALCLDRAHPQTASYSPECEFQDFHKGILANRFLHGNGSQHNSCNRWFDAIQVLIGEDGGFGGLLEHSVADGPAAVACDLFCLDAQTACNVLSEASPVPNGLLRPAEKLEWNISPQSAEDILMAKDNIDRLILDVDLQVLTFADYGLNILKSYKLSPDGFIQNAIQLAYYKLYQKATATYESGATRFFKLGRTDTIRSTTNASQTFVKFMSNPNSTINEKAESLVGAVKAHSDYTIQAISGQAVDRHLLGLRLIALESGMETPDIFKDSAYSRSIHFCLSTSQVPEAKQYELFFCFGAVVPDGYGVCYNPQETKITVSVSSFRGCPETDSLLFGAKLAESLREMQAVMTAARGKTANL